MKIVSDVPDPTEQVLIFFKGICKLSDALCNDIRYFSQVMEIPKKIILIDIGHIHKKVPFIIKGAVRIVCMNESADNITSCLFFEDELAISYNLCQKRLYNFSKAVVTPS